MLKHVSFAVIALFWVIMNALLWHSEIGPGHDLASSVPAASVWERILTAPDDSSLSINVDGKKIGFVRWRPTVGLESASGKVLNENEPEGIVRKLTEYSVEVDGSFVSETLSRSLRFTGDLRFHPDLRWKRFETQLIVRPAIWRFKGNAEQREFWLQGEEDGVEFIRRFPFDDLKNPRKLMEHVESPMLQALLAQRGALGGGDLTLSLNWTARSEWLRIGQSKVRVYRLNARLLEGYEISVLVSRVGEILKLELPLNVKLINDSLFER